MSLMSIRHLIACSLVIGWMGCSDDGNAHKDAALPDTAPDASPDAGTCPANLFFTGEFVDWNSSEAEFCGIFQATWQVHGDPTRTHTTPPNGRVELCLQAGATTQIDIAEPTEPSQCPGAPGIYTIPGIAIANSAVIASGTLFSARSITASELQQLGITIDLAKAQVFVHVAGTPRSVTITQGAANAIAFDGTAWAAGTSGVNVFFPNVDPTGGSTMVQLSNAIGTGAVPLVPGVMTYTTIVAN